MDSGPGRRPPGSRSGPAEQPGVSAPQGTRSTSPPASRRSVSTSSSYIRSPDCSGQTIAQSHRPHASPAKTARSSGASFTCQSGVGRPAASTLTSGGPSTRRYGPGSGPSIPAYRAPSPTPSSSATSSSSPMPPSGPGPEQATAVARPPPRSSPAHATPVKSQPTGSGQGIQTGTRARWTTTPSASTLGGMTGCIGCTLPCTSHCQVSSKKPGALTRPPHFGQLGSPLITTNRPPRPSPRQGRSPFRREALIRGFRCSLHLLAALTYSVHNASI